MVDPTPFSVDVSQIGPALVVTVSGEIDIATVPAVRAALDGHDGDAGVVVLDLRRLSFMDTSGLQLLVEWRRRCEGDRCALAVVRGPTTVQRLLDVAGLTPHLWIVDTPEEAIADGGSTAR